MERHVVIIADVHRIWPSVIPSIRLNSTLLYNRFRFGDHPCELFACVGRSERCWRYTIN